MTITARIVKAVVTLPILGTISRNDKGEVIKSGERYRVHIYAPPPGLHHASAFHSRRVLQPATGCTCWHPVSMRCIEASGLRCW